VEKNRPSPLACAAQKRHISAPQPWDDVHRPGALAIPLPRPAAMNMTPSASGRLAVRLLPAAFLTAAWSICCGSGSLHAAEPGQPRSHLQPVSEIVQPPASSQGLGIALRRASPVLRRQLALKRGAGLVVDEVAAGSRAAAVGFVQHDVLVRLDDQLLLLPEQFDALLESAEADDRLECIVLRGGREVALPLGTRPESERPAAVTTADRPERRPLRPAASALALVQPMADSRQKVTSRLRQLSDETLLRQDPDYRIRLSRGDETRLLVSDATGRVVFDGPIDAAVDRARVPAAIRGRVAEMEQYLETAQTAGRDSSRPVAEIGSLGIRPVELQ